MDSRDQGYQVHVFGARTGPRLERYFFTLESLHAVGERCERVSGLYEFWGAPELTNDMTRY